MGVAMGKSGRGRPSVALLEWPLRVMEIVK